MPKPKVEGVVRDRPLTPDEAGRYRELREKIAEERSEIERRIVNEIGGDPVESVAAELRHARLERGLSLTDVSQLSGLKEATIVGLESGTAKNRSVQTLNRYAKALGKRIRFSLEDEATKAS